MKTAASFVVKVAMSLSSKWGGVLCGDL